MNPRTEPETSKPRLALLLATGFGLGYLPIAPGTWGSLAGLALAWCFFTALPPGMGLNLHLHDTYFVLVLDSSHVAVLLAVILCLTGVWASGRAARHLASHDPQVVVIDEIFGQFLALLASPGAATARKIFPDVLMTRHPSLFSLGQVNWKYLLLGFILFRVFDIWKPFPARQAERLPSGWGIMADDWVAGIYAALGLWAARALGL